MPKVETEITIRLNDDGTADLRGMASDAVVDWEERHGKRVVIAIALAAVDENGEAENVARDVIRPTFRGVPITADRTLGGDPLPPLVFDGSTGTIGRAGAKAERVPGQNT